MDEFYLKKFNDEVEELDNEGDANEELEQLKKELKRLKKEEKQLLQHGFAKDKKVKILENQLRELTNSSFSEINHKNVKELYGNHNLSKDVLKTLRSVPAEKKYDATFVRKTISSLYEGNIGCLSGRSRVGTKERLSKITKEVITPNKSKLTPDKLSKINILFKERINFCANTFVESLHRKKRINNLISESLRIINNHQQYD